MSKAEETKTNTGSKRGFGDLGVLIALSLLAATFRGCNFSQPETTPASKLVNTSEITYNPDQFMYRTVTIRSKALDKVGPASFTVKDKQLFDSEPIVVVNASGVPFNLPADRDIEVQVTGSVRRLNIPQIERDYNLNLQDEYYKKYINKPAVIAQEIKVVPQQNQITQGIRQ
ncbi:hypothetical protein PI95_030545 [Hassallia byssoidea VB512170]|uniref:Uncharacterized protein n=1 Tax=Hassallia byssoidea VB512170 TaxID=1304833 RepID=A0A846HKQ0_9CYAN|nr:hypothetical protein [Hassalia byssoidea]NEU76731.1 hypothetical protein [Hassalia byssoidea VB512170]